MKTRQIKMVHAKPLVQYVDAEGYHNMNETRRKLEPEEIISRIADHVDDWDFGSLMKLFKEGEL